ncbi:hypothetical protein [Prosthecomicrobium sp. N25]|uniref:hypothetical protein n=1 Tax=Prosthecomicrobium sp. N25 TaxID=3129254 RepID=UPI0030789295
MIRSLASLMLLVASMQPVAAACSCGPDFCTDDPRIPAALRAKKAALAKEYPARLVALLDRGTQCVARIERGPDGFSLVLVQKNGDKQSVAWTEDDERIAKTQLASGTLGHYWIVHSRRAFACCGEPAYDARPDYDARDDVNASLAIRCDPGRPC